MVVMILCESIECMMFTPNPTGEADLHVDRGVYT